MLRTLLLATLIATPALAETGPPYRAVDRQGRVTDATRAEAGCLFPLWRCGLQGNPQRALAQYRAEAACERVTDLPLPREAWIRMEANLRAGPSIEAPRIALLSNGDQVRVLEECQIWRRVQVGALEGWVHSALLTSTRL